MSAIFENQAPQADGHEQHRLLVDPEMSLKELLEGGQGQVRERQEIEESTAQIAVAKRPGSQRIAEQNRRRQHDDGGRHQKAEPRPPEPVSNLLGRGLEVVADHRTDRARGEYDCQQRHRQIEDRQDAVVDRRQKAGVDGEQENGRQAAQDVSEAVDARVLQQIAIGAVHARQDTELGSRSLFDDQMWHRREIPGPDQAASCRRNMLGPVEVLDQPEGGLVAHATTDRGNELAVHDQSDVVSYVDLREHLLQPVPIAGVGGRDPGRRVRRSRLAERRRRRR